MPEIAEVYQSTPSFNLSSWDTENVYLADCTSICILVLCSSNCTIGLKWKTENGTDIFYDESKEVIANDPTTLYTPIKARYVQFSVDGFDTLPCSLKTQGFYF